jgi:Tfp pilus assembly PilM family ATPase
MQRLIALEWDSNELRVALARQKGKAAVVDEAFAIPFHENESRVTPAEIGQLLGKELQQRGIPKGDALIAVGRANLELRFLTTPPAPAEELPDLVRFQAMRQFTTLGDDWPLDYSPLGTAADGSANVLATAVSPEIVGQIRSVCAAAGLTPKHLVLRPFAAAALLRSSTQDETCRLTVDMLGADADLAVLIGPNVVYPRTVRLPSSDAPPEMRARALLGEVRRTIVAAQNQLGGRRVEQIIIFGDETKLPELQTAWKNELQMDLKVIDPFSAIETGDALQRVRPATPGAYAPLLGLLADEASGRSHAIDFLHPRKRPPPPNRNRLYQIVGGSLAASVLVLVGLAWWNISSLNAKLRGLEADLREQTKLVDQGKGTRAKVQELEKFSAADVNWLDEIERLSQRFPTAEQARVEDLLALAKTNIGGGNLVVQGVADQPDTINAMESALRDDQRTVMGSGSKRDPRSTDLAWRYREEIVVHGPDGPPQPKTGRAAGSRLGAGRTSATGGAK